MDCCVCSSFYDDFYDSKNQTRLPKTVRPICEEIPPPEQRKAEKNKHRCAATICQDEEGRETIGSDGDVLFPTAVILEVEATLPLVETLRHVATPMALPSQELPTIESITVGVQGSLLERKP